MSLPSTPLSPLPVLVSALQSPSQTQMSPVVALSLEAEPLPKAKRKRRGKNLEAADLPPAKRISKVKLTYCEAQENISNLKRVTRSSKSKKKKYKKLILYYIFRLLLII